MSGHKNFAQLRADMSPVSQARANKKATVLRAEMPLHDIREAMRLSQVQLGESLGVEQPAIAKMERRADMYVSTVRRFIEAMGGELHITATFPQGSVEITNFHDFKRADSGS